MNAIQQLSIETLLSQEAHGTEQFFTEVELQDGGDRMVVNIPLNARVTTKEGRWIISDPKNPLWRWSAGGGVAILQLRDIIVALASVSDSKLPVWPSHLTAATGISGSINEWVRPRLLMREAFEAIVIATPTGIVIPSFGDPELDELAFGTYPRHVYLIDQESGIHNLYTSGFFESASAKLLPLRGEKEIVVCVDGMERATARALPVLDPATRGIDLMHAYEIDLSAHLLSEISVFYSREVNGRAINQEIVLLELDQDLKPRRIARSYKSGHIVENTADMTKMSPVLRQTLAAL